jgi:hypothetical protein
MDTIRERRSGALDLGETTQLPGLGRRGRAASRSPRAEGAFDDLVRRFERASFGRRDVDRALLLAILRIVELDTRGRDVDGPLLRARVKRALARAFPGL